jgi:hypothetical protein
MLGLRELRVIRESTSVTLGHVVNRQYGSGGTIIRYRSCRTTFRRPRQGRSPIDVRCGECGAPVRLYVKSVGRTKRKRLLFLVVAVLGLVLPIGAGLLYTHPNPVISQSVVPHIFSVIVWILCLPTIILGFTFWWLEDGIDLRLQDKDRNAGHILV